MLRGPSRRPRPRPPTPTPVRVARDVGDASARPVLGAGARERATRVEICHLVCSHSSAASTQVAWAFAKRLGASRRRTQHKRTGRYRAARKPRAPCSRPGRKNASCASPTATSRPRAGQRRLGRRDPADDSTVGARGRILGYGCKSRRAAHARPRAGADAEHRELPVELRQSGDGTSVRKELFSELADAASKRVDEFNAQELGQHGTLLICLERLHVKRAWAYATASEAAPNCSTPSRRAPRAVSSASSPKIWRTRLGPSRRRRTGRRACSTPPRGRRRAGRTSSSPKS